MSTRDDLTAVLAAGDWSGLDVAVYSEPVDVVKTPAVVVDEQSDFMVHSTYERIGFNFEVHLMLNRGDLSYTFDVLDQMRLDLMKNLRGSRFAWTVVEKADVVDYGGVDVIRSRVRVHTRLESR